MWQRWGVIIQVFATGWQSIEIEIFLLPDVVKYDVYAALLLISLSLSNENQSLFFVRFSLRPISTGRLRETQKSTLRGSRMPIRHTSMVVSQGFDMKRA